MAEDHEHYWYAEKSDVARKFDELESRITSGKADAEQVERDLREAISDLRSSIQELTGNINRLTTEMNKVKGTWEHGEVKYG